MYLVANPEILKIKMIQPYLYRKKKGNYFFESNFEENKNIETQ